MLDLELEPVARRRTVTWHGYGGVLHNEQKMDTIHKDSARTQARTPPGSPYPCYADVMAVVRNQGRRKRRSGDESDRIADR